MALDKELQELLFEQILRASARWTGATPRVESPERRASFQRRELLRMRGPVDPSAAEPVPGVEAILGSPDFQDAPPDRAAERAGLPVARIVLLPDPGFDPLGFATGFLVAPQILLTNNHVLPGLERARRCGANFRHEQRNEGLRRGELFELDPDRLFLTDIRLDFTVVAVKPRGSQGGSLADYGFARLIEAQGKILIGQPVNIIQHPSGGPKKWVTTGNLLTDLLDDFLRYGTDTLRGSSGSPAFNTHWEAAGLHHCAIGPMRDGNIITRDGRIFTRDMDEREVDWIANEGVRVSVIAAALRQARLDKPEQMALLQTILRETADPLEAVPGDSFSGKEENMVQYNITFTGPVTIYTGAAGPQIPAVQPAGPSPAPPPSPATEGVAIDQNYSSREGYKANFLAVNLDLPALSAANSALASQVLKYHHFSIVMNKTRRLAFFTAVNIDGRSSKRPTRQGDAWFYDPRLDRQFQIGEFLYASNPLDRGHLVRRLDPAWGTTPVAKKANDDTFHFTNCSPQHANLNQRIWNDLEDYLLDNADQGNLKLTVFTGPVFDAADPTYRGVQLPRRFWKVAVMVASGGSLLAAGFMQSQERMIDGLRESDFLAEEMRTDQVLVSELETLLGMSFGLPAAADPLTRGGADESLLGVAIRPLSKLEDIKLS